MQFPARTSLRTVRQLEVADCGAACLAAVLRTFGDHVPLAALRDLTQTGRDGVSLLGVATAARSRGYTAIGLPVTTDTVRSLTSGAILHWNGNHFVVLVAAEARGLRILDPALGERLLAWDTVPALLTGTALIIEPTAAATRQRRVKTRRWELYRPLLAGAAPAVRRTAVWAVLAQSLALIYPLFLRKVVDDAGAHRSQAQVLTAFAVAAAVAYAITSGARLLSLVALQRIVDVRLSTGVLAHLVSLPYSFLARRSTGDLALRLRSTVVVRQILTTAALSALLDGALVLLYLALVAVTDSWFAVLTVAVIAAQVVVVVATWRPLRRAAAEALAAQTRSQEELVELVEGLQSLKATGAAPRAAQAWERLLIDEVAAQTRSGRLSGGVATVLGAIRFGAPLLLLSVGLGRVDSGALTLGQMLAVAALATAVTVPTGELLSTVCSLSTVASYVERLDDLLSATPERRGGRVLPMRGALSVELTSVGYRYSALLEPALTDITLHVEAGEHVAIVGASGSGKSTLAMLVAGLYAPTQGRLSLGGIDAEDLDPELARTRIGVVTQATTLFNKSLLDNIAFGRADLTRRQILASARKAAIHDDIAAMSSGYATRLGPGGSGLSGGQRQRVALARALAGHPGLLVLDEATSALDSQTEEQVSEALTAVRCTRLVIAHRMSTVRTADRVVVLEHGRVVAEGTYASLQRRSPEFRALTRGS